MLWRDLGVTDWPRQESGVEGWGCGGQLIHCKVMVILKCSVLALCLLYSALL